MTIQEVLLSVGMGMGLHPCITRVNFESIYGRFLFCHDEYLCNECACD